MSSSAAAIRPVGPAQSSPARCSWEPVRQVRRYVARVVDGAGFSNDMVDLLTTHAKKVNQ